MNAGTLHPNRFTNSRFPLASPPPMTFSPLRFPRWSLNACCRRLAFLVPVLLAAPFIVRSASAQGPASPSRPLATVIHGGARTILRERMTPERDEAYRAALEAAVRAGHAVLTAGGSSVDAVVAAVQVMEDSPLFNADVGAVLTGAGTAELDAAILDGSARAAGAVAGVRTC